MKIYNFEYIMYYFIHINTFFSNDTEIYILANLRISFLADKDVVLENIGVVAGWLDCLW